MFCWHLGLVLGVHGVLVGAEDGKELGDGREFDFLRQLVRREPVLVLDPADIYI
jgi:hypothetical protein